MISVKGIALFSVGAGAKSQRLSTTAMSFHTSQFQSSGSTTTSTNKSKYRHFTDPAEFDLYVAERGKKNAEGLRALGVPIIDFNVRRL